MIGTDVDVGAGVGDGVAVGAGVDLVELLAATVAAAAAPTAAAAVVAAAVPAAALVAAPAPAAAVVVVVVVIPSELAFAGAPSCENGANVVLLTAPTLPTSAPAAEVTTSDCPAASVKTCPFTSVT